MRSFCDGVSLANTVVRSAASASSSSVMASIHAPRRISPGSSFTSWQTFRVMTSLSPVRIFTRTPLPASAAIAAAALSLGGSRKAMYPSKIRSRSSAAEYAVCEASSLLVGHGHDAETVRIECDRLFLCGCKVAFIEPARRSVDLVARADCENFLDRPLAYEDVLVRPVGHHHR